MSGRSFLDVIADEFSPAPRPFADDPVGWIRERAGEHPWSAQREILRSLVTHRRTAVRSAHAIGKSWLASRAACWWIDAHPPGEAIVVTTAPTFAQVKGILWQEIARAHKAADLDGRLNQTEWYIGNLQVGIGRKPSEYDPSAFQGIHRRYVLVIIDEAAGVPAELWPQLDSLVSNDDSRILAIGNPDDPGSRFAKVCAEGSGWNSIRVKAFDTPNFTGEAIPDSIRPLLISPTWVEEKRADWGESSPLWVSKIEAQFPLTSDDSLIPYAWAIAATQRDCDPGLPVEIACDVARFGSDSTVIVRRQGSRAEIVRAYSGHDTMETVGAIEVAMADAQAEVAKVDVIGVGSGVVDRLKEKGINVAAMNAASRAGEPDKFINARAEWYWQLRKRFETGEIAIPPDDSLLAQLTAIRYDTRTGKVKIESKDDMRRRGVPSPDRADALMLAFAQSRSSRMVRITSDDWWNDQGQDSEPDSETYSSEELS